MTKLAPVAAFGLGFLCAALLWLLIAGALAPIGLRNVKKLRKPEQAIAECPRAALTRKD